ncbi:hypothetical protein [Deinococcus sonorensis]|uniref:Uncharacterized protein n=2 Tax=Deinococcus sonorensis TaxID=309891 RepID=A0AAU7U9Y2_9DEIO
MAAQPSRPRHTGQDPIALLLPGRADLGRFVQHLIEAQVPVSGASTHLVSGAMYLQDPEHQGIEV